MSDQHEHDTGGAPPRSASVQLRPGDDAPHGASMMDPANQSLAEALRITYKLLQLAMVVLAVLYIGSGFQSVQANQRGVMLVFGKVVARDLKPGFHLAPPYPFGELVKVDVGNQRININRQFWPYVEPGRENAGLDQLRSRAALSIEQDGSLLTGDGAIAHAQWQVQYARGDASTFAENVYPGHETGIIRAAVQRGIVHAVAGVGIDELLKQSSRDADSVAIRARAVAREMLESTSVPTGIELNQLSLEQKIPPAYLRESFNSVLQATSRASSAREEAQKEGNTLLAQTAGGAAPQLIELIDEYERLLDLDRDGEAAAVLAKIDRIFDGVPVEIGGEELTLSLGGEVSGVISRARQYRSDVVERAKSDLTHYRARLAQYQTNPSVMVSAAWTEALVDFFDDERVQTFFHPTMAQTLEVVLNADPEILAAEQRRMLEAANEAAQRERLNLMERARTETDVGNRLLRN